MAFLDDALANTSSISDTQASAFATSRLISFLGPKILGQDKAYSLSTIDIPEAGIIDWMNVNLYDINGRILFRDKTLLLPDGREIRLRVAASALLRVPVWSVGVGMPFDLVAASLSAKVRAQEMGLSFETGEQSLVCYCYPKLGILCRNDRGNKVVIDLTDFNVSSVEASSLVTSSEQKTTWSPYDLVVPSTLGSLISKWDTTVALMPAVEADGAMIIPDNNVQTPAIETIVNLKLRPQETDSYCAVATAQMILAYYNIDKSQDDIAVAMHTTAAGTENPEQVAGYSSLSSGRLTAQLDENPSFVSGQTECQLARPFKSGVPGHARAVAGYKKIGDSSFLCIFDPYPVSQGAVYWEDWNALQVRHTNFLYVRLS